MNKQLNYQFNLEINRVYLYIGEKCQVKIWWKKSGKGGGGISTQNSIRLHGNQQYFDVNEKLSIAGKVTIENGVVKDKTTLLRVMIFFPTKNQNKLGGQVPLNLSQIISIDWLADPKAKKYEQPLKNCPVSNSRIMFTLSAIPYKQQEFLHDISFQTNNFSKTSDLTFRVSEERKKGHSHYSKQKKQKPMEFSFNPSQTDQEKFGVDKSELIKDLKQMVEEKNIKIKKLQKQIDHIRCDDERNSEKNLSIMNELNTTMAYNQQIKKENTQIMGKFSKLKDEKTRLEQEIRKIKEEKHHEKLENQGKLTNRERMIEDLTIRIKQAEKKFEKVQDELFRKQSDLINLGKEQEIRLKEVNIEKNMLQTNNEKFAMEKQTKLRAIEKQLIDLKSNYDFLAKEREDLNKINEDNEAKANKYESELQRQSSNFHNIKTELERRAQEWKNKYLFLEANYKEKESLVTEIEYEFKVISEEKEEEGRALREKFNSACKKIDELEQQLESRGEKLKNSYQNQISTLNARIRSLQQICSQLEAASEEKDEILEKAKLYVASKDEELEKKEEMLCKAKIYIENKQKQFSEYMSKKEKEEKEKERAKQEKDRERAKEEKDREKNILEMNEKQRQIRKFMEEVDRKEKQIQDMERYIDFLRESVQKGEDQVDQLERKNQSQQETLKELVKKNLDMEIQLNIKNYELDAFKAK